MANMWAMCFFYFAVIISFGEKLNYEDLQRGIRKYERQVKDFSFLLENLDEHMEKFLEYQKNPESLPEFKQIYFYWSSQFRDWNLNWEDTKIRAKIEHQELKIFAQNRLLELYQLKADL